ncbi:hypothetical protein K1X84_04515 [bacterium]|nr:hypothetical protein [bacterium]
MERQAEQINVEEIMRNKTLLRITGFLLLGVILTSIGYIFYSPHVLTGNTGIFYPVALFATLLLAFYLLILSTKS